MGRRIRIVAVAALAGAVAAAAHAVVAAPPALRPDAALAGEADDAVAALRKAVLPALKRPGTHEPAVAALRECASDEAAFAVALEALVATEQMMARAVDDRDAEADQFFAYYRRHIMGQDESSREKGDFKQMREENRAACKAIRDALDALRGIRTLAQKRCIALGKSPEGTAAMAARFRAAIAAAKTPRARAFLFSGLGGVGRSAIADDLLKVLMTSKTRMDRVGAAWALGEIVTSDVAVALRGAADTDDPYVRRAIYDVVGSSPLLEAVDLLVGRIRRETGRAREDLVGYLTTLTGETFGDAPQAWTDWWTKARESWTPRGPGASRTPPSSGPGSTRYFGLDVRSDRVLFVLDCSLSMENGTLYPGQGPRPGEGERKFDVAMRELEQAVRMLPPESSVSAVAFGTTVRTFSPKLLPATADTRKRLVDWVRKQELEISTNVGGALIQAFDMIDASETLRDAEVPDTIVMMTDGRPNSGPIDTDDDVIAEVYRRNWFGQTRIHAVYLGSEGDVRFLQSLVNTGSGQFVRYVK